MFQALLAHWLRQHAKSAVWDAVQQAASGDPAAPDSATNAATDSVTEPEPPFHCDVVVAFASAAASGGLVDRLSSVRSTKCATYTEHVGLLSERPICVTETGKGRAAVENALRDVITLRKPRWIVHTGFATGLQPHVRRGQLLMAHRVVGPEGISFNTGLQLAEQSQGQSGTCLFASVDEVPETPEQKRQLGIATGADICDRDSFDAVRICRELKLPMMAVRIVSSAVDDDVARVVKGLRAQDSLAGKFGAVAGALIEQPGVAKELWRVKEDALRLSDRLAEYLVGVIQQLP